jgi:magnesium transporter
MSAWAAIFAVITMLAGISEMNFAHMPELRWSFGYPLLLFVTLVLSAVLYRKFKKSGWL